MRVVRHLEHRSRPITRAVLTLGNFDGVHLGHQAIIAEAVGHATAVGGQAVALTFEPHPMAVLVPERAPPLVQPLHDRLVVLRGLGVDVAVVKRFTRQFAALEPEAFVRDFLRPGLDLVRVVVGWNVNFGRARSGSVDTLRALGGDLGFAVDVVGPVTVDGTAASSSTLRRLLGAGDVRGARAILGRPHTLRGRVVRGDQRGRTLGFPTANLHLKPRLLLPPAGVYAVRARLDGARRDGVLNLGVRPTFGGRRGTGEVHFLDWDGDCYGRWVVVELIERLRGEVAFSGPAALREAIAADVTRARTILGAEPRDE